MSFEQQFGKIVMEQGFIAALDQSGGSTPKALKLYGVEESDYTGEAEMFDRIHQMRSRIATAKAFNGARILGAILFEMTVDREIKGKPSARYLWENKSIIPFLKVDKGLEDEKDGVQLMKPMPDLQALLNKANDNGVFGTKMRSVIQSAHAGGIRAIVDQQFEIGRRIIASNLVPIIEPEVNINAKDKTEAEVILRDEILRALDALPTGEQVMLKLTLPDEDNFYLPLIEHPAVVKVVALSGGYSRQVANEKLARNNRMIASFSRALTEGLNHQQSEDDFESTLDKTIEAIYQASIT